MRCALMVCVGLELLGPTLSPKKTCDSIVPNHIRIQDCSLAHMVAQGLDRSPTLRRQIDLVAELHGIVYVVTGVYASLEHKELLGALSPRVVVEGKTCVLRITLKRQSGLRAVATFAHELQHAIEVLEVPDARTEQSIEMLFERTGSPVGYGAYETPAALASEATVLRELRGAAGGG